MTQADPYIRRTRAQRYEEDLQLGIVNRPDESARRHETAYITCALGPRCTYPVSCCPECHRHKIGGHTCQR